MYVHMGAHINIYVTWDALMFLLVQETPSLNLLSHWAKCHSKTKLKSQP